ncbi:MAG: hypothetical protein J7J76_07245 [Candidatus Latescibacteria bacterium]|nr:hypothetical protein [Candidatus Latescibacterota bacterium]
MTRAIQCLGAEPQKALSFLTAGIYPEGLARRDIDTLIEHRRYAYIATQTASWNGQVGDEMFFSYVLPHRILKEPAERWRREFYEEIYPRVKDLDSLAEAAMEVNRWAAERAEFKRRRIKRDHTPKETIKRGCGNCADLTILYVAACRSVGIPARAVFAPWLTHKHEGRHFWTEVWDGRRWCYVGSCEPIALNRAWFTWHVRSAAKVYAFSYWKTGRRLGIPRHPDLWVEDVTGNYTETGILKVRVTENGRPAAGRRLIFAVQNSDGSYKPVASALTDDNGLVDMALGTRVEGYYVAVEELRRNYRELVQVRSGNIRKIELKRN